MPRPSALGKTVGRGTPCILDASGRRNQHGDRRRDRRAGAGGEARPVRKSIPTEQREAAWALWPCILRWNCGRVRSLPLARGHRAIRAGLPAGAAVATAPGATGEVVPAKPRVSPVPRNAASRWSLSVSGRLLTSWAVVELIREINAAAQHPSASRRPHPGALQSRRGRAASLPSGHGSSAKAWRARRARRENWPERVWTSPWDWDGRTANGWPIPTAVVVSSQGTSSRRIISMSFFNGLCSVLGLQEKWYTLHQQGGRRHEMSSMWSRTTFQRAVAVTCGLLIGFPAILPPTAGRRGGGAADPEPAPPLFSPDPLKYRGAPVRRSPGPAP